MSEPRIQAIQTLVRLIYEDGTVGMISADLDVVDRDELEPAHAVSMASVLNMLAAEYDVLRDLIAEQGLDELYKQVKKNASERRAEVTERANEAHRRHQLRPSNQN